MGGITAFCSLGAIAQSGSSTATTPAGGDASTSAQVGSSGQLSSADREFVRKAAEGGLAEVELGQLATEKASSQDVKQFGQRMVSDHSQANTQLKEIAAQKGVTLPMSLRLQGCSAEIETRKPLRSGVRPHLHAAHGEGPYQ